MNHRGMKIVSVVGARPNIVKMAPIHKSLSQYCEHVIVHTGQHYDYEMTDLFFKELQLREPDINLGIGSGPPGAQVGEMIKRLEIELRGSQKANKKSPALNPGLVIVYGDTNSTLAGAFAAAANGIPVAHVEAGLRSFDSRMPEERNRILTDHLSNILFAPTETAVKNLKHENVKGEVVNSGDISVELVRDARKFSKRSLIIKKLNLRPKSYVLFTMHRAESTDSEANLRTIIKTFQRLGNRKAYSSLRKKLHDTTDARHYIKNLRVGPKNSSEIRVVFPLHPRTEKMLKIYGLYGDLMRCNNVVVTKPLGYIDFIRLVEDCYKVVTDSGGVQKEAFLLSVPCVTIRNSTEWIETVSAGWNVLTGFRRNGILKKILEWHPNVSAKYGRKHEGDARSIFGRGNTSEIIREYIISRHGR
jgi:UDP-N-acetylglucosamine 2-epimerase